MLDLAPPEILVCEWCDEEIDQIDIDVEAFEVMGAPCCSECHRVWNEDNGQFGVGA